MSTIDTFSKRTRISISADTRVSRHDRVLAILVAGVAVTAALVCILFLAWLAMLDAKPQSMRFVRLTGTATHPDSGLNSGTGSWLLPGVDQFPESSEPELADKVETVIESVSLLGVQLQEVNENSSDSNSNQEDEKSGRKSLLTIEKAKDVIPDWERWKIDYSADSMASYMALLDSLGISLGAVSQISNKIVFLDDLTAAKATLLEGDRNSPEARRMYFRSRKNQLRQWEIDKLRANGIDVHNVLTVQFYSEEIRKTLTELELAHCESDQQPLSQIEQTSFGVRSTSEGFEYYVVKIEYRSPSK